MKQVTITCDGCGKELGAPSPMPGYYLEVKAVPRPPADMTYAVAVYPPIRHDLHFCGKGCLRGHMFPDKD